MDGTIGRRMRPPPWVVASPSTLDVARGKRQSRDLTDWVQFQVSFIFDFSAHLILHDKRWVLL